MSGGCPFAVAASPTRRARAAIASASCARGQLAAASAFTDARSRVDQLAALYAQAPPLGRRPDALAHRLLGGKQLLIATLILRQQRRRRRVLDDASSVDDHHA